MISFAIFLATFYLILTGVWLVRIAIASRDITTQRNKRISSQVKKPQFHLVLPVLNENERLHSFVHYFLSELIPVYPAIDLWIVSTEKENILHPNSATLAICKEYAAKHKNIHHVHSRTTNGTMAHQLNYALGHIPTEGITGLYNADSRPEKATFGWVAAAAANGATVFQQYGIYTKNAAFVARQPHSATLVANMLWQCQWTIGFEYYRALIGQHRSNWPKALRPFNYCIGHGLFAKTTVMQEIGFSESTSNEDAIFGIEVAAAGLTICPVPYFDLAESPDTVSSIYSQKTIWFQGPFRAFSYYFLVKNRYQNASLNHRFILWLNCSKLFTHAIYWVTRGLGCVILFIIGVYLLARGEHLLLALAIGVTCFGYPTLPMWASTYHLKKLHITKEPFATNPAIHASVASLTNGAATAHIVQAASGVRGIVLSRRIQRGFKPKTKMSQYKEV